MSFKVSPLLKLEVAAEILITSALNRTAASSKEVRVRSSWFDKKIYQRFPTQRRQASDFACADLLEGVGGVEDEVDFVG